MTLPLLLAALVGYGVLAAVFVAVTKDAKRHVRWLGLAAIAVSAPVFVWFGAFSEQFSSGQCYSSAIASIASAVEHTHSPEALAEQIRALPMHGYETICTEVESAARRLPHGNAR